MAITATDYKKIAPELSKVMTVTAFKKEHDMGNEPTKAILTKEAEGGESITVTTKETEEDRIKAALPYILHHDASFFPPGYEIYDVGYGQISKAFKLPIEKVKELHEEMKAARNKHTEQELVE